MAVEEVIRLAGGVRPLGRLLGISPQAISQWTQIPIRHVLSIERLLHIPREKLRPDIYPPRESVC